MRLAPTAALLLAATAIAPAIAHVTLDPPEAPAGTSVRATLRVPHGCAGAATERFTLRLPEDVFSARPMPKPGWRLTITRRPLDGPAPNGQGGQRDAVVSEVTWEGGPLPDDQYDEFVVMLRAPAVPGQRVYIPVIQTCTGGATAPWTEIPDATHPASDLRRPAPSFLLLPGRRGTP
jgi:uncharacterized protein YcnI